MSARPPSSSASPVRMLLGALTASLLLGACASQPYNARGAVVPQAMYQPAEASNPYTQTTWALRQWSDAANKPRKLPLLQGRPAPISMSLHQDNGRREINGWVACNPYSGDYTVANGVILLTSDLASAGHDCGSAGLRQFEQTFLEGMKHIVETSLDDYSNPRLLTLRLADGDRLEFVRQPSDVPHAGSLQPGQVQAMPVKPLR